MARLVLSTLLFAAALLAPARSSAATGPAPAAARDTLRGTITDSTGAPLGGAIVIVSELGRTALTDSSGRFAIADIAAGRYTIVVRRAGYAPLARAVVVPPAMPLVFALEPSALRLEPVTITATRSPLDPMSSPLPSGSLFGERLRREHEVSLAQALEGFAGVRNLSTGEQVGKPIVHGLTGPRVLVLDNGLRLEDYSWSDEDGPSVDSRLAERIEMIRGPSSVLYGSDAMGGVINVVPEDVPDARGQSPFLRGAAEAYGATNNAEVGGLLRLEGASGAFGWRATAIGRRADNFHTPKGNPDTPTGDIYDTGFHAVNGEATVGVHGERASGALRYERYGGDFGLLDGPPVIEDNESGPLRRLQDDRVQGTSTITLGGTRLETRSQWQRHALKELVGDSRTGDGEPSFDLLLNTFTTDVLLHHARGEWLTGTMGISGLYQDNTSRGVFPLVPDARTANGALFAFEQATFGRWSVLAGARGDAHRVRADTNEELQLAAQTRTSSAFSGDVGLVFRPVDGLALAANLGRAFRAPTLFELFTHGPHLGEDRYEVGLPTAVPELATDADVSVRWQRGRLRGEIAGYRNRIAHFLFIQPTGTTALVANDEGGVDTLDVYQYTQTAHATLTGLDVSGEVEAHPMATLRGRFDYVRGTNDATHAPLPLMPPARGDLEAELHTPAPAESRRSYVSIGTTIVARQSRLGPFDIATGGYALLRLGAGISRALGGRPFYLDMRVLNATNRRYHNFLSRYKEFAFEEGRNVIIRISTGL